VFRTGAQGLHTHGEAFFIVIVIHIGIGEPTIHDELEFDFEGIEK